MDFWTQFRLLAFLFGLILFTSLGLLIPRRPPEKNWVYRFGHNLLLGAPNGFLVRILLGWGLVEWTLWVQQKEWGLLNQFSLPTGLAVGLFVVIFDGIIYWQHVATHHVPWLWRLHRVHHSDTTFDASTAVRFHFVEIAFSFLLKCAALVVVGGPVLGVVIFEVVVNFSAMFNHSNLKLGAPTDRWLRKLIVTPDFHRVHHSVHPQETNANFGFFLSIWDYLFGSYVAQPKEGHEAMAIGLTHFRDRQEQNVAALWLQPLRKE